MTIEIQERAGQVQAMGHSVSLEQGGEAELRRRCFETLSRLNTPPDEVQFVRVLAVTRPGDIALKDSALQAPPARSALRPPPPEPPLGTALGTPLETPLGTPPRGPLPTPTETPRAKRRPGR